ncbi:MAG: alpha/beta fold hydrolase [Alphaproteobacteria bacterium]
MIKINTPEGLEERFTQPAGFRFHSFEREQGRRIRFGSVFPKDSYPDAVVLCLPGLSECIEKYFETARDLLDKNLAVYIMDWMGQGGSDRYTDNPHKRHSAGFEEDVKDLAYFYSEYIKHSSVVPDKGRLPLAMLAHSMGGNIGLRFMAENPDVVECASISAPMAGIAMLNQIPKPVVRPLAEVFARIAGDKYAFHQYDWGVNPLHEPGKGIYSNDAARDSLHRQWVDANPDLQIGGVTFGWVRDAVASCQKLHKAAPAIQKHVILGLAEQDTIVDNDAIRSLHASLPNSKLLEFQNAKHEILMETDDIRREFLNSFYQQIQDNILAKPETLKPF